jgi:hypothetical protein
MFKVEVIADSSGKWCGNALTFDTVEAAKEYGADLYSRWTLVQNWRVVEVETEVVMYVLLETVIEPNAAQLISEAFEKLPRSKRAGVN